MIGAIAVCMFVVLSFYSVYSTVRRLRYAEYLNLNKRILESLLLFKVFLIEIFILLLFFLKG